MFTYRDGHLCCESIRLADIAAAAGTPCYVYSSAAVLENFRAYDEALGAAPHLVCYSVKASSSLGVLSLLAGAGAGFDIVSGGELYRVLRAGGDPSRVVFSGVGKTAAEIEYALDQSIHSFNCESKAELELLNMLAGCRGVKAEFALRVNPDVDASTHPYISTGLRQHKFGIDIAEAEDVYGRARAWPNIRAGGVSCHIGSQILDAAPLFEALDRMLDLVERLRLAGHEIRYIDAGGGLGIAYTHGDHAPRIAAFAGGIRRSIENRGFDPPLKIMIEPGRSIAGPAGVLLTRVLYRKRNAGKQFIVVDAAMNDLIRPALYAAWHEIAPLCPTSAPPVVADVVGPVCESGDFLARDREVAGAQPGECLAVHTAGAYGFVLASNYNSRPRPPEVLVEGGAWRVIRARETYEDLIRGEYP